MPSHPTLQPAPSVAPDHPGDTSPFLTQRLRTFARLVAYAGQVLFESLTIADRIPSSPVFARISRAIRWMILLAELLAGSTALEATLAPSPAPAPNPAAAPRRARARARAAPKPAFDFADDNPELAAALRELQGMLRLYSRPEPSEAELLRAAFGRPIGEIAASLCADLDIQPGSRWWPAELIAITQTPAEWTALLRARPDYHDAETLEDLATPPKPAAQPVPAIPPNDVPKSAPEPEPETEPEPEPEPATANTS